LGNGGVGHGASLGQRNGRVRHDLSLFGLKGVGNHLARGNPKGKIVRKSRLGWFLGHYRRKVEWIFRHYAFIFLMIVRNFLSLNLNKIVINTIKTQSNEYINAKVL
jgi:hypothetical protein